MEMDIRQIQEILPHRYPFLLIDRVTDMEQGKWAKAIKCVTANEPFFQGHFPGRPVMPGVLIIEALAQTGAVAVLCQEEYKGKTGYLGGIQSARFRGKVVPGDVLMLEVEMIKQKGPVGIGKATASVNGRPVVTAELTFAIG